MASIIPVFIPHEGCPHDCVFCNQRRIAAPVSPAPEDVHEQVCTALQKISLSQDDQKPEVAFYGGSFTAISGEKQEAYLKAVEDLPVSIRVSTRPDAINREVLERLSRYNVKMIELGAQSMSDTVLLRSGRGHTARHTVEASAMIKKYGFSLVLQTMCGLPGDEGTYVKTAQDIAQLCPDAVRIYPVVVIRDTALYDMWQSGIYKPLTPHEGAVAAADMLEVFLSKNIPVIRIGLNPTAELSQGGAVAGAYHPALGEMARSEIYLRRMIASAGEARNGNVTFYVNAKRISQALGIRRENINRLHELGYVNCKLAACDALGEYEVKSIWS